MYNIVQLNEKSLTDLQAIAKELGITKTDSLSKEDLVYKILDEQAISNANKIAAKDKQKEEKTKRKRVTVTNGKLNKVFSANKEGTISREEQPVSVIQKKVVEQLSFKYQDEYDQWTKTVGYKLYKLTLWYKTTV